MRTSQTPSHNLPHLLSIISSGKVLRDATEDISTVFEEGSSAGEISLTCLRSYLSKPLGLRLGFIAPFPAPQALFSRCSRLLSGVNL